jgi:hypothetical protein
MVHLYLLTRLYMCIYVYIYIYIYIYEYICVCVYIEFHSEYFSQIEQEYNVVSIALAFTLFISLELNFEKSHSMRLKLRLISFAI